MHFLLMPVAVAKEESVEALPDPLRSLPGNGYNGTGSLWIGALTPFIYLTIGILMQRTISPADLLLLLLSNDSGHS